MWRYLLGQLARAAARIGVAFGLFGLISQVPWPADTGRWIAVTSVALLAATVLITCGTLLYNTLFYERYWRSVDSR